MDVKTAFLNGDLEEDIYMDVPMGMVDETTENMVCKLRKALYGLKQAPRQWYAKINSFLMENLGYSNCPYEPCIYTKHDGAMTSLIALYVDDLLIASSDRVFVDKVKLEFQKRFRMKLTSASQHIQQKFLIVLVCLTAILFQLL